MKVKKCIRLYSKKYGIILHSNKEVSVPQSYFETCKQIFSNSDFVFTHLKRTLSQESGPIVSEFLRAQVKLSRDILRK